MGEGKIELVSKGNKEAGHGESANVSTSKSDAGLSPTTLAQLDLHVGEDKNMWSLDMYFSVRTIHNLNNQFGCLTITTTY